eukprot:scaffold1179_cov118-Isochrysis_galbana.AAC.4
MSPPDHLVDHIQVCTSRRGLPGKPRTAVRTARHGLLTARPCQSSTPFGRELRPNGAGDSRQVVAVVALGVFFMWPAGLCRTHRVGRSVTRAIRASAHA